MLKNEKSKSHSKLEKYEMWIKSFVEYKTALIGQSQVGKCPIHISISSESS